jgi:hypothetical protein
VFLAIVKLLKILLPNLKGISHLADEVSVKLYHSAVLHVLASVNPNKNLPLPQQETVHLFMAENALYH